MFVVCWLHRFVHAVTMACCSSPSPTRAQRSSSNGTNSPVRKRATHTHTEEYRERERERERGERMRQRAIPTAFVCVYCLSVDGSSVLPAHSAVACGVLHVDPAVPRRPLPGAVPQRRRRGVPPLHTERPARLGQLDDTRRTLSLLHCLDHRRHGLVRTTQNKDAQLREWRGRGRGLEKGGDPIGHVISCVVLCYVLVCVCVCVCVCQLPRGSHPWFLMFWLGLCYIWIVIYLLFICA